MIDLHIVAVRQENPFAGKLHDPGRSIDLHSALRFEIVTNPHVVITRHENHPNPRSVNSHNFPNTRTNPLGTTRLYSNQKSKRSPRIKTASASRKLRRATPRNVSRPHGRSRPSRAQMNVRCEVIHSLFELRFERPLQPYRKDRGPLRYPHDRSKVSRQFLHVVKPSAGEFRPRKSQTEIQGSCCSCTALIQISFETSTPIW